MPTDTLTQFDQPPQPEWPPQKLVLFLDECIPVEVGQRLTVVLKDDPYQPEIIHLTDYFEKTATPDETWADEIRLRGWLPVTADRGKRNFGVKLPKLLREMQVIHVTLSAKVHQLKTPAKTSAILACWPKIIEVWRSRIGCCHSIQFDARRTCFRLVQKY